MVGLDLTGAIKIHNHKTHTAKKTKYNHKNKNDNNATINKPEHATTYNNNRNIQNATKCNKVTKTHKNCSWRAQVATFARLLLCSKPEQMQQMEQT